MTLATVLTLGLGMGATTALFGLLDRLVFRTIPAPRPEQLHAIVRARAGDVSESVPYPLYAQLTHIPVLGQVAGYAFRTVAVDAGDDSAIVQLTTANWLATVGVRPAAGREWDSTEHDAQQALISDAFWQRKFSRSPRVIGTTLSLDGHPFTITGVMKPGFTGVSLDFPADVWISMDAQTQLDGKSAMSDRGLNWVRVIARLDDSMTVARAEGAANLVVERARRAGVIVADSTERMLLASATEPITRDRAAIERVLYLALALAGLVLLIACANVANLQLARSAARRREIAVRLALGAGRARLVRQLLTESLMLATLGAGVGLWVAFALDRVVTTFAEGQGIGPVVASLVGQVVNGHTLLFTATLSCAVAIGVGLLPAARSSRVDVVPELRQTGFSIIRRTGRRRVNPLLGTQLAMSLVLLITALMVSGDLRAALSVDLGFRPSELLQVSTDWRGVPDATARADEANMVAAVQPMAGIVAASVSSPAGFGQPTASTNAFVGSGSDGSSAPTAVEYVVVSPDFFSAMGMRVVAGQGFSGDDRAGTELVTVVNESAARRLFPIAPQSANDSTCSAGNDTSEWWVSCTTLDCTVRRAPRRRWCTFRWRKMREPHRRRCGRSRFVRVREDRRRKRSCAGSGPSTRISRWRCVLFRSWSASRSRSNDSPRGRRERSASWACCWRCSAYTA